MVDSEDIVDVIVKLVRTSGIKAESVWNEIEGRLIHHLKGFGLLHVANERQRIAQAVRDRIPEETELSKFIFEKLDRQSSI